MYSADSLPTLSLSRKTHEPIMCQRLLPLFLLLLLCIATGASSQCLPVRPCTDCDAMSVTRNDRDCQIYFLCSYGRLISTRSCGFNQIYSPRARTCISSRGPSSRDRCPTLSNTPTRTSSSTSSTSSKSSSSSSSTTTTNTATEARGTAAAVIQKRFLVPQFPPPKRPDLPIISNTRRLTKSQQQQQSQQPPQQHSQRRYVISIINGSPPQRQSQSRRFPPYRRVKTPPVNRAATATTTTTSRSPSAPDLNDKLKQQDKCGIKVSSFIIGGQRADRAEWAWQVSIQTYDVTNNRFVHVCGGTLVQESWVVTAAHCVYHSVGKMNNYIVVGGQYRLRTQDPWRQIRGVDKAIPHFGYRPFGNFANDIALLRLSAPFNLTTAVRPACLPSSSDFPESSIDNNKYRSNRVNPSTGSLAQSRCWTTGWGKGHGREIIDREILREVRVNFMDPAKCRQLWPGFVKHFHICVLSDGGKACKGDSGGPMVCVNNGRYFLQGVVSWGEGTCNLYNNMPTVFTRVADFVTWINYNINRYVKM